MWAVATITISLSLVALASLLYRANERKHSRIEKAQREKAIEEARQALHKAMLDHPGDVALHATLRDALLRLQGRKQ